jgi:hypothetical protein
MTLDKTPRTLICSLILAATLLSAPAARAGSGREIAAAGYFILAGLQIPAVAFEFVGYSRLHGQLDGYAGDADFASTAGSVANCNLVGGILHSAKFVAWTVGGVSLMADGEGLPMGMVALNGGLDMANAIMGITAGAMILGARDNVDIGGTPLNQAATLAGVVHLVFGSISAIVALPELMVGVFALVAMAETDRPQHDVRVAFSPTGVTVFGRF